MSPRSEVLALIQELRKSLEVLRKIEEFYESQKKEIWESSSRTQVQAILFAEILVNYYTCVETIFFRIAQFFENNLSSERWHQDLLDRMTIELPSIRPRVLSDETQRLLRELLRFRHFKRYYFEFEYDWDRLEFLRKKFESARPRVREELNRFVLFLQKTYQESEEKFIERHEE